MRLDAAFLDEQRRRGDPLADAALAELPPKRRASLEAVEAHALSGGQACRALLGQASSVPPWVQFDAMTLGSRATLRTAVTSGLSLLLGSLVETYASAKGAKVLVRAGGLLNSTLRRIYETAAFSLAIARSQAPRPGTQAHRFILHVRLMHAKVRAAMLARGDFDGAAWGLPINQEDSVFTLLAFSHVLTRGLDRLGARLTVDERASLQHTWRWVGFVVGVDEALLPTSVDEAARLYDCLAARQLHPDDDGRLLTRTLLEVMAGRGPFFLPRRAMSAVSRVLIGDALADGLGLERRRLWGPAVLAVRAATTAVSSLSAHVPGVGPVAERAGLAIAVSSVWNGLRGSGHPVAAPPVTST